MPVKVGDTAPDFELPGRFLKAEGRYEFHTLRAALQDGPVLLHFFPAPYTQGCEAQMCSVRDTKDVLYDAAGVTVFGVTGHYPSSIAPWAREHRFNVPILADYEHTVSEAYVGFYEPDHFAGLRHVTMRGLVAVGRDGMVRYAISGPFPPTDAQVAEAIASVTEPAAIPG